MVVLFFAVKDSWILAFGKDQMVLIDRGRIHTVRSIDFAAPPVAANIFDDTVVVLTGKGIDVLSFPNLRPVKSITFASSSYPTCMLHPTGYLNKFLVGFNDGAIELWNINSGKLIYSFQKFSVAITVMENSSVIDVIAVGLVDGTATIHDVRQDKSIFSLHHNCSISCLSFRTDLHDRSQLAVGMIDGSVALWDLDCQRIHLTWPAHQETSVGFLSFVHNQPVLISASGDNSIKEWIIEGDNYSLLRSRSGHSKPPSVLKFCGEEGESILSGGQDRSLRNISMIKDSITSEVSQGSIQRKARELHLSEFDLKLSPVIALDVFQTKNLKWDNAITAHESSCLAQTWRVDHLKVGSHSLSTSDKSFVTAVVLSSCGNFAFIGSTNGIVDMYNMQSGLHRKKFVAGDGPIIGLAVDAANSFVVAIHSSGLIRCLDILSGQSKFSISLDQRILMVSFSVDSNLLAVSLGSAEIQVFDMLTTVLVRRFVGHQDTMTSLQFSSDGKWLLSASKDQTLRTWDLSTGHQIDCLLLPGSPTSLTFSPTLDFLAVSFEGDVAIHLWTNMSFYNPSVTGLVSAPVTWSSNREVIQSDDLLCLSSEPKAKYLNLYNLDLIKARSKPALPAPSAAQVPFFLDSLFSVNDRKRNSEGAAEASQTNGKESASYSLRALLMNTDVASTAICDHLRQMDSSCIDLELRSVLDHTDEDSKLVGRLLDALINVLDLGCDFEMIVAILSLSLKIHKDTLLHSPAQFSTILSRAGTVLRQKWDCLEDKFQQVICFTTFSRNA